MSGLGFVNKDNMALLTDLYELTMAQVYFEENHNKTAVFDFFVRPTKKRPFFIFAGLEGLIEYLLEVRFTQENLDFLKTTDLFSDDFLHYLSKFRFTGNMYAFDEGEFFFANEPVVIIEAPIIQAQIVETFLINSLQLPILVATKALRCYKVANGKPLVEFGLRRAHSADAGMRASRASYIGGFAGSSNVLAGKEFGIPVVGTMAHSFILSFEDEERAFEAFAKVYPENSIFLVDTYNPIKGTEKAVKVAKKLSLKNFKGVRIDSGDLYTLSLKIRKLLDENGFKDAKIIASGGINEYKIKELEEKGAKIDGYGVGTELVVSADVPYLDCAYKLVEYNKKPVMKFSSKKLTLPAKKQVYRQYNNNFFNEDIIGLYDENIKGEKLLNLYIKEGRLIKKLPPLKEIREKTVSSLKKLPPSITDINKVEPYIPKVSDRLKATINQLKADNPL